MNENKKNLEIDIQKKLDMLSQNLRELTDNTDQEISDKINAAVQKIDEAKMCLVTKVTDITDEAKFDRINTDESGKEFEECLTTGKTDVIDQAKFDNALLMEKLDEVSVQVEDLKVCMATRITDLTDEARFDRLENEEDLVELKECVDKEQDVMREQALFDRSKIKKEKHERYSSQIGRIEGIAKDLEMHKEELKNTTFSHLGDPQN